MKILLLIFIIFYNGICFSQNKLNIYDISQKQLRIMKAYKDADTIIRSKVFIDSLYTPYQVFWNGYLGKADDVEGWLSRSLVKLPEWEKKNESINGAILRQQFYKFACKMKKITGYAPEGSWYVVYGPAWTDLGGLGNFAMLIDLAHANNNTNETIIKMFPHELTHQIMTNVNKHKDCSAISAIIGEGFAVWMNQKYWKRKFTLAQNLGYTDEELLQCDKSMESLKKFFDKNKYSNDKDIVSVFRSRDDKLNQKLPGAIGYYIGYHVIESYIQKNGKDSWKDVFLKDAKEIYENSGFIE